MLIYAPRNEEEVDVVMQIVAASVWWVSGVDVNAGNGGADGKGRRRSADVAAIGEAIEGTRCGVCKMHACRGNQAENLTGNA